MRIHFLPLNVNGACDANTGDIFMSHKMLDNPRVFSNCLVHEVSHVLLGSNDHGVEWKSLFRSLGGFDLFTQESGDCFPLCLNIGNISGIQNILTDYHLLQAYRRFSQKILGTEGHWDVVGEADGDTTEQLIRLYPTPKGSFPVVVMYYPVVNRFRSTQAKLVANEMLVAEAKCMVGAARRKIAGIPMPDGGTLALDGEAMAAEGLEAKEKVLEKAIHLSEPLGISKWSWLLPLLISIGSSLKDIIC